jgi:hypothetical protein
VYVTPNLNVEGILETKGLSQRGTDSSLSGIVVQNDVLHKYKRAYAYPPPSFILFFFFINNIFLL